MIRLVAYRPQRPMSERDGEKILEYTKNQPQLVIISDDAAVCAQLPVPSRCIPEDGAEEALRALCTREGIAEFEVLLADENGETVLAPLHHSLAERLRARLAAEHEKRVRAPISADVLCMVPEREKQAFRRAVRAAGGPGKLLLAVGQTAAFDKGSCAWLKQAMAGTEGWRILHLSETPMLSDRVLTEKLGPHYHRMMWAAFPKGYPAAVTGSVPDGAKRMLSAAGADAAENLALRFPELGREGAAALALYLQQFFTFALGEAKPDRVLVWNAFTAAHMILLECCRAAGVPVTFMEFGLLPGTIGLDRMGQMGCSELRREPRRDMPPEQADHAGTVLKYLAERNMNRNQQNGDKPGSRIMLPAKKKPLVLLIGQNDFESGICPYNEAAKRDHSPRFASSQDALEQLAPICRKNGWQLIYRPHPAMAVDPSRMPEGVWLCRGGDLFSLLAQVDLTVTLMSQVAYEALIHHHNVLLLGYCQLSGKGAAWEPAENESTESVLRRALAGGLTPEMETAFRHHIARVLETCAWDDGRDHLRYGRSMSDFRSMLEN